MDIFEAIDQRHCKRAFLSKTPDLDLITSVLQLAGQAASSKNTQPWQVAIVSGQTRDALSERLCALYDTGEKGVADYTYSMQPLPDAFKERARDCGYSLFDLKGIARDDYAARQAHGRENMTFFGAPLQLIFHLPEGSERGNFLDMGLFMQNVMLGLTGHGLGSCPQFSIAQYASAIKTFLGLDASRVIVAGMSVGYPDPDAVVNTFIPQRLDVNDYTQIFD